MVFGKNRRGMITRLQQSVKRGLVGRGLWRGGGSVRGDELYGVIRQI